MTPSSAAAESQGHVWTVDDVFRMVDAGLLDEQARVELIEGELIDMSPIGSQHSGLVNRLTRLLIRAAGDAAVVSVENALRLSDITLPQPDFGLLLPRADDYRERLPTSADLILVVEVADSSLRYDRNRKMPLYARHGVPEAWLIEVGRERLVRFRDPSSEGYQQVDEPLGLLAPALPPACAIDLADLFRR